jgi:hypothetical protein
VFQASDAGHSSFLIARKRVTEFRFARLAR